MGYYVAVQFSFSCNSLWRLREAASATLVESYKYCRAVGEQSEKPSREDFNISYTKRMLEQVGSQTDKYIHYGNKGDMFIWGGVWNYYNAEKEISFLKEFLWRCWQYCNTKEDLIFDFDRALLIVNKEESGVSNLYEFSLKEGFDGEHPPQSVNDIIIKSDEIGLCWNQY